jgi:uncharacterized membrane protein YagU involved in acid resistance
MHLATLFLDGLGQEAPCMHHHQSTTTAPITVTLSHTTIRHPLFSILFAFFFTSIVALFVMGAMKCGMLWTYLLAC